MPVIGFTADALCLEHFEDFYTVDKSWRLAKNDIAGVYEDLTEQIHGFQTAVHNKDIIRFRRNALWCQQFFRNNLTQLPDSLNRAIL